MTDPGRADGVAAPGPDTNTVARRGTLAASVVIGVGAAIPRLLTVGHGFNADEYLWMHRTVSFSDALRHGDLAHMSASYPTQLAKTMPGIPTMWLGSVGRVVWEIGRHIGFVESDATFAHSVSGYTVAQSMVALASAVLIALLVWLVARWTSLRVAMILGVVVATGPMWVALGSILHLDELVTLFSMTGLVALAWALGLPRREVQPNRPRRWAIVGGVLCVLAPLTKLSGLTIGPAVLGMVTWAVVRCVRERAPDQTRWHAARPVRTTALWMVVAALATIAVTYPALVLDPVTQLRALAGTYDIVSHQRIIFFAGHATEHVGPWFYPVSVAYHVTWWVFVLLPIGMVAALLRRPTRAYSLLILTWVVVPAASLLVARASYARYALIVLGPCVLVGALAIHEWTPASHHVQRWGPRLAGLGALAVFGWSIWVAPWGAVTFNPILAAVRSPKSMVEIGWGQSSAAAIPLIEAHAREQGKTCADITISPLLASRAAPAAKSNCNPRRAASPDVADYVFGPYRLEQKYPGVLEVFRQDLNFVGEATVNGQPVALVWERSGP